MKSLIVESRYLNPLTDFGFHRLFGTESCKELLIDFLNGIIKEEGLITDIQYLPPEQLGNLETDRRAIFDIFCVNEKEEYFIVEMQKAKQPYFRDRSLFYASFPIRMQAPQGIWDYRLKAVYLVAVLDFILFDEFEEDKEQVIESVHLVRERTKTLFSRKLNFVFVELPKFRKPEEELKTNTDKWLYILKNLSLLNERPRTLQGRIFEKLFQLAEVKQLTVKDMEAYRKSILKYQDVRSAVALARDEGREEGIEKGIERGIEEGRKEEKVSVIQKCLQNKLPIEVIINITGFSKEQIMKLR